jgi:hypothetical protein
LVVSSFIRDFIPIPMYYFWYHLRFHLRALLILRIVRLWTRVIWNIWRIRIINTILTIIIIIIFGSFLCKLTLLLAPLFRLLSLAHKLWQVFRLNLLFLLLCVLSFREHILNFLKFIHLLDGLSREFRSRDLVLLLNNTLWIISLWLIVVLYTLVNYFSMAKSVRLLRAMIRWLISFLSKVVCTFLYILCIFIRHDVNF